MLVHNSALFRIYFGNAHDKLYPAHYQAMSAHHHILLTAPFNRLQRILHIQQLMFLRQTHSAHGYVLDTQKIHAPFSLDGDYLITNNPRAGLGIMTADCLPIIFVDIVNMAIGIAHAGWRGSVAHIAVTALNHMKQVFNTDAHQLRIFFGPSAKACCYRVTKEFAKELEHFSFAHQVLQEKEDYFLFDLPYFNRVQLENSGVPKEAFHSGYNICTICDDKFFSYRRQKEAAGRQMTVVALR